MSLSLSFLLVLPFSSGTVVCFLLMRKTRNKSRHIFTEFPAMQNCRTPSFCLSTVSLWAVLFFSLSAPSLSRSPVHQSSFGDVHSNNINVCSVRTQSMTSGSSQVEISEGSIRLLLKTIVKHRVLKQTHLGRAFIANLIYRV